MTCLLERVGSVRRLRRPGQRRQRARRAGRRALYLFVAAQPEPVSRDQAAAGSGLPRHTAKFHLDKLVEDGLLDTEFRRLSGRQGPGAGRPTKLYRRSERQVAITLPQRHYELAGQILAERRGAPRPATACPSSTRCTARPPSAGGSAPRSGRARTGPRRSRRRRRARRAGIRTARPEGGVVSGELSVPRAGPGPHRARVRHEPAPRHGDARRAPVRS